MKKIIAVIGAGNIGTRHLQAILKCQEPCDVFAVEPSEVAIAKAQKILQEQYGRVTFCSKVTQLPKNLEVVIVAVSSKIRRKIVEELLIHSNVKYLILEKVLFPQVEDYIAVKQMLEKTNTKAWVNCVRRSWPYTKRLQELFSNSEHISMYVSGNMWGIGCNTIHYIDWLSAITQSDLIPVFDISEIDDEIIASKRTGYVEFTGKLFVKLGTHNLQLTSEHGVFDGFHITIEDDNILCTLREIGDKGTNIIRNYITGENIIEEYECPYQSNLTNRIIFSLLTEGKCALVGYEQSMRQHIPMIKAFLEKMGKENGYCNIT